MRRSITAVLLAPLMFCAACLGISTGTGTGSGSESGASTTSPAGTGASAARTGTLCGTDPSGRIALCEGIDLCPGVTVDPGVFPNCGFRLDGASVLDIECVCGDSICPVGAPQTCSQVTQLLGGQSGLVVCEQVAEGRCVSLGTLDAGSARSCTAQCQTECAGVPDCLTTCGC